MSFSLFEVFGVELEYMIVDAQSLDIRPLASQALTNATGQIQQDKIVGNFTWSNELVQHVLEIKCHPPTPNLLALAQGFHREILTMDALLQQHNATLLGTGAHPWKHPDDTLLWQWGDEEIYAAYNRIFNCRGHGWSNLQSAHLNLPFRGDEEFARLHQAIRLLLPILPALTASTPFLEGKPTGWLDTRLFVYQHNQAEIPAITGKVIPEVVMSESEYRDIILAPIYKAIAPFDPDGILQEEWLNSRGAIARFERSAIEIRTLDLQECPKMDIAIMALLIACLQKLTNETWSSLAEQAAFSEVDLYAIWQDSLKLGFATPIHNAHYLKALGFPQKITTAKTLWMHLFDKSLLDSTFNTPWVVKALETLFQQGNLAERLTKDKSDLKSIYRRVHEALINNETFVCSS